GSGASLHFAPVPSGRWDRRREAPPTRWVEQGARVPEPLRRDGGQPVSGSPGRLGPPFDGSRNRVDNARVWGRRERLQRVLGPSIFLSHGEPSSFRTAGPPVSHSGSTP